MDFCKRYRLRFLWYFLFFSLSGQKVVAQAAGFTAISAEVDFSQKLRSWDGFGFNYVQTAQTFNFSEWPQDYGGFRFLKEKDKQKIAELIFGADGLKVGLLKMFLDPLHQEKESGPFDHKTTTRSMVDFAKRGLTLNRADGRQLEIITTMYGPPSYVTKQKIIRGRDLDTTKKEALVNYLVSWAKYLRQEEKLPLKYVSLHNEGEDWKRWPSDGTLGETNTVGHDYNFYWSPEQVVDITNRLRPALNKAGLQAVGITPGENTNWYRFSHWGFARALYKDAKALQNTALITSHGFYVGDIQSGHWFGPHSNVGTELIRQKKPAMRSWVTSTAWQVRGDVMNALFIKEIHGSIYEAKVNGIIPWSGIQTASQWNKPDPNLGCAIRVYDDGTFEIQKGYHFYKQVSRAGQPGMAVVLTQAMDTEVSLIGFAANQTKNSDAFVVINVSDKPKKIAITIKGSRSQQFAAFRTNGRQVYKHRETAENTTDDTENFKALGSFKNVAGTIIYESPAGSVTTFFAQ